MLSLSVFTSLELHCTCVFINRTEKYYCRVKRQTFGNCIVQQRNWEQDLKDCQCEIMP